MKGKNLDQENFYRYRRRGAMNFFLLRYLKANIVHVAILVCLIDTVGVFVWAQESVRGLNDSAFLLRPNLVPVKKTRKKNNKVNAKAFSEAQNFANTNNNSINSNANLTVDSAASAGNNKPTVSKAKVDDSEIKLSDIVPKNTNQKSDQSRKPASAVTSDSANNAKVETAGPSDIHDRTLVRAMDLHAKDNADKPKLDSRKKQLSVDISSFWMNNESKSGYSPRAYISNTLGYSIKPKMKLDSGFSTSIALASTIGASVDQIGNKGSTSAIRQDWTTIGFQYSRERIDSRDRGDGREGVENFADLNTASVNSLSAVSIEGELVWSEYKFNILSDDLVRTKHKTSGFGLGFRAKIPSNEQYSWVIEGLVFPSLTHTETGSYASGGSPESTRLDFAIGGEVSTNKHSQVFYELKTIVERNRFSSTVYRADPETGLSPSGVVVQNSFYLFSLGYRWGE